MARFSVRNAAKWISDRASAAYRAVDPDVPRHLAQVPLLAFSLVAPRRARIVAGKDDGHPPLIFVHGMGARRGCFTAMSAYLWLHGRRRSYALDLSTTRTIEAMARRLADYVRAVRAKTGARKVDIVAHSLGGVVARLALLDEGLRASVGTLVTLGAPHGGTYAARYGGTRMTRALRPDSPLMRRLAKRPFPRGVRGVSLWSRNDLFVLPPESAALAGTRRVDVTPFTHYSYLVSPKAFAAVREALGT